MNRGVGGKRPYESEEAVITKAVQTELPPPMATMAAVLLEYNPCLLRLIRKKEHRSLTELAGRQAVNLSRTLWIMDRCSLVELNRNVREIEPMALATSFKMAINCGATMKREAMRDGVIIEADTCREFVTRRLVEAGWDTAPQAIGEQRSRQARGAYWRDFWLDEDFNLAKKPVRRSKQKLGSATTASLSARFSYYREC